MDLIPLLSTIILVATIVTIVIATGSFLVYKMREAKKPLPVPAGKGKTFFRKYEYRPVDGTRDGER